MAGGFVLVVGPSGAGKDTLLGLARERLGDAPRIVFPRRLVTRPPSADEDNDEITQADFERGETEGAFALSWRAHGLGYAIPGGTMALAETGRLVVCNVSRRVVGAARGCLRAVSVVEVTASPETLARRLQIRGRAEDGDIGARLSRQAPVDADLTILNEGDRASAAAELVVHILGR